MTDTPIGAPSGASLPTPPRQTDRPRGFLRRAWRALAAFLLAQLARFWHGTWDVFVAWLRKPPLPWRYRWQVISRTLVGALGGFYLAESSAALIARGMMALDVSRNDATLSARMIGFILMAVAVMWAYGCATQRRAWLGVGVPAALTSALAWWLRS